LRELDTVQQPGGKEGESHMGRGLQQRGLGKKTGKSIAGRKEKRLGYPFSGRVTLGEEPT